jgi:hypothetical protein
MVESRAPVLIRRHMHVAMQNYKTKDSDFAFLRDLPSSYSDAERLN